MVSINKYVTKMYAIKIIRVFCPMAGLSLKTQESRLQFCPKAVLPLQTGRSRAISTSKIKKITAIKKNRNEEPRFAVLLGINRCGSFPLLSTPYSLSLSLSLSL